MAARAKINDMAKAKASCMSCGDGGSMIMLALSSSKVMKHGGG
jgi:hypothetical protein